MRPVISLLTFILTTMFCFSQTYDTVSNDAGKPGGYMRIRLLDAMGNVEKIWYTSWNEISFVSEYSEYDKSEKQIARVESVFNSAGELLEVRRDIGDVIEQEKREITNDETVVKKSIALYVGDNIIPYTTSLSAGAVTQPCMSKTESDQCIIAEFDGSDIRNTKPFVVSSPWEVQWNAEGEFFNIYLYAEDGSLVNVLGNQSTPGSGSSYYPKSGKYYFSISTMGDWKVKVVAAK